MTESTTSFVIKWSGSEYPVEVSSSENGSPATVIDLKKAVHAKTGVRPDRQKLLGLKVNGKAAMDDTRVCDLSIKPGSKIMMMGSKEEDIAEVSKEPENLPEVVNDLDIPDDVVIPLSKRDEYLAKIEKRVKEVKIEIMNPPRPGKKLLVLDIDYTLFDHRSVAEHPHQLMRPYLHDFLTSAYEDYDIVIWCKSCICYFLEDNHTVTHLTAATSMKWIEVKMRQLGVTTNPDYKITFMMDSSAMIALHTHEYGFLDVSIA
jgi:ubiquitin-like domain-containing CTD phosphatase 1